MKPNHTSKADETPEFVEFWQAWQPHMHPNDGRGDARNCFFKHVREGANPADIRDGGKWFIRNLKPGQFMPHSQTWINRRAYEDGAEQERAMQRKEAERAVAASLPANVQQLRPSDYKTPFQLAYEKKQATGEW